MARYIPTSFAPRLYNDWYLLIKKLPIEKQTEVIHAIFEYPNYIPTDVDCWDFLSSRLNEQFQQFLSNKEKRTEAAKKGASSRWSDRDNDSQELKPDENSTTHSKSESVSPFIELTEDPEIINALKNKESGLSIFLETGAGYEASLTKEECIFADQKEVRALCKWHKDLMSVSKQIKKFTQPTLEEWLDYCKELNLDEHIMKSAYESYKVAGWHDTQGNPVRNWKQKILQVWNKPQHYNKQSANFNKSTPDTEQTKRFENYKEFLGKDK